MNAAEVMALLRHMLADHDLPTEVVSVALSGSCYLRFEDYRMGQIRIGDHNERECYGYRWQIRLDLEQPHTDTDKGHKRYFYPPSHLYEAVMHMVNYRSAIARRSGWFVPGNN